MSKVAPIMSIMIAYKKKHNDYGGSKNNIQTNIQPSLLVSKLMGTNPFPVGNLIVYVVYPEDGNSYCGVYCTKSGSLYK